MPGCKEDTTWSVMGDYWYLPGRKLTVTDGDWSQTFQEYCLRVSYQTLNHTANGIAPQSFCGSDERWKLTVKNPVVKKCSCCNHRIVTEQFMIMSASDEEYSNYKFFRRNHYILPYSNLLYKTYQTEAKMTMMYIHLLTS